jgi:hypothetical protein
MELSLRRFKLMELTTLEQFSMCLMERLNTENEIKISTTELSVILSDLCEECKFDIIDTMWQTPVDKSG